MAFCQTDITRSRPNCRLRRRWRISTTDRAHSHLRSAGRKMTPTSRGRHFPPGGASRVRPALRLRRLAKTAAKLDRTPRAVRPPDDSVRYYASSGVPIAAGANSNSANQKRAQPCSPPTTKSCIYVRIAIHFLGQRLAAVRQHRYSSLKRFLRLPDFLTRARAGVLPDIPIPGLIGIQDPMPMGLFVFREGGSKLLSKSRVCRPHSRRGKFRDTSHLPGAVPIRAYG